MNDIYYFKILFTFKLISESKFVFFDDQILP